LRMGAGGISSDIRDRRRKGLRIASSAPPALSLSKVQNSRNSLPCPLMPRTKTGWRGKAVPSGGVLELVELLRTVLAPNAYAIIAGLRMTRQAGLLEMTPWFGGRQEVAVRCISPSREMHADHHRTGSSAM